MSLCDLECSQCSHQRGTLYSECPLSRGSSVPTMSTCPHGCMHTTHITHTLLAHTHAHMHIHLCVSIHACTYIHLNYRHVTLTWIQPCWFLWMNRCRARYRRWGGWSGGRGCSVHWNANIIAQACIAEAPQLVSGDFWNRTSIRNLPIQRVIQTAKEKGL